MGAVSGNELLDGTDAALESCGFEDQLVRYDVETAAGWILEHARRTGVPHLATDILGKKAQECSPDDLAQVMVGGLRAGLRLHPFKSGMRMMPRIRKTFGFLRSVPLESMLDVGSGRGVFLIPFLREFPWVQVTSVDVRASRVAFLDELARGCFPQLRAERADICDRPYPDDSFDVVTLLEVLEHIPDVGGAVEAAVAAARRHVIVTVPSKPDDNPEHIHLLTRERLRELFWAAGCTRLNFDGVEGHLFMVATVG